MVDTFLPLALLSFCQNLHRYAAQAFVDRFEPEASDWAPSLLSGKACPGKRPASCHHSDDSLHIRINATNFSFAQRNRILGTISYFRSACNFYVRVCSRSLSLWELSSWILGWRGLFWGLLCCTVKGCRALREDKLLLVLPHLTVWQIWTSKGCCSQKPWNSGRSIQHLCKHFCVS